MSNTPTFPLMVYESIRSQYTIPKHPRITVPQDILQIKSIAQLSTKEVEYFVVLTLNGASEVIKTHIVTKGLLNHSLISPRECFRSAIKDNAAAIIAVHNHPSGSNEPSSEDIKITKQLKEAGNIIGISLLDHLIITHSDITSLRSLGYL